MDIRPNGLARNGTAIICVLLAILALTAYFIKYPETIATTAKLRAINAPKPVWVYQSGKLAHLLRQNGDEVEVNEIIGCMETMADWQEVLRLSVAMDSLCVAVSHNDIARIEAILSTHYNRLGELQNEYQVFTQAYIPFKDYVIGGYAHKKRTLLQNDLGYISRSKSVINQQSALYSQDAQLSQTNLDNNKELLKDNVISEQEYRELTSQNIGKKLSFPQLQSGYINADAQTNDKQKELLELDNQIKTQQTAFREAVYKFKSSIDDWKHQFLLTASVHGILSFTSFIQENQVLDAGKAVAYVSPKNNSYYLQASVPQNNLGKVVVGQKVLLKFNAWQWQEYGTVTGKVEYLSDIATDSGYITKIILPDGLRTNRQKTIVYKEGLDAQAEIITKDMSLIERFYYSIIKQVKRE